MSLDTNRTPFSWRRSRIVKAGTIVLLLAAAMFAYPRQSVFEFHVNVGDVWRQSDVVSTSTYAIFKTEEELEEEYRQIRESTAPVFRQVPFAANIAAASIDSLKQALDVVYQAYSQWQINRLRTPFADASDDSVAFVAARASSGIGLSLRNWSHLLESYAAHAPGLASATRAPVGSRPLSDVLLDAVEGLSNRFSNRNVIGIVRDSISTDAIVVLNEEDRTEKRYPMSGVSDSRTILIEANDFFARQYGTDTDSTAIAMYFFRRAFRPNLVYVEDLTEERWNQAVAAVSRTRGIVREGEVIVRSGEVITEETKNKLNSLTRTTGERGGRLRAAMVNLGQLLLTIISFSIFFLFLFLLRRPLFDDNRHIVLISTLFAIIIGLCAAAVRAPQAPDLAVPVAIAAILLTVFYDSRVGIFATLSLALLGAVYFGYDFKFMGLTLFACSLAVFSVRDIKRRAQFVTTALLVLGAYVVMLGAFALFDVVPIGRTLQKELVLVGINSVLVLLSQPLIEIFERVFGVTTEMTYLELSDTNRPLLRELSLRAPGSFNHSLQVANLSEAAADAIGANAIKTRVGALYHDIGKMLKPEYYVENQIAGQNPHDNLDPRMSAQIVASHVTDGAKLAEQRKLPAGVRDFIPMHHGTARMEYFYNQAKQDAGNEVVSEEDFRYPGPRPNSRETAIVMLADSVEAAARSVDEPTPDRFERLISSVVAAKLDDGQLDLSPLTLLDITKIKGTFVSMLSGVHHLRIKYPGQERMLEEPEEAEAIPEASSGAEDVTAGKNGATPGR